jgi:glycolate oxidase iron-sulfur subunit
MKGLKLTWHDPCHLNRHLGLKEQPRQILNALPDVEYIEMPDADRCCGMAGQFNLYYYELSQKIAEKKVENIEATGADVVVTACPGCQFQLVDALTRQGKTQKVMSLVEILN